MAEALKTVGKWAIALGILTGIIVLFQTDWKEAAWTGILAAMGYLASGVVTGIMFMAAGEGLDLLRGIKGELKDLNQREEKAAWERRSG